MNRSNTKGKGVGLIISAVFGWIFAWIFFSWTANAKGEWQYYWDAEYRGLMDFVNTSAWIIALVSVGEFIAGLVLIANGQTEEEWLNSNLTTCPDCHKSISRQAEMCPHCGRKGVNQSIFAKYSTGASRISESREDIPTWKRIQMDEVKSSGRTQQTAVLEEKISVPAKKCPECGTVQSGNNRVCYYCNAYI